MHDRPTWKTAPPLWKDGLAGTIELEQPAILRFDSDDFTTRLQAELDEPDHNIGTFVLRAETWRSPLAGLAAPEPAGEVPRLFQPIHGRFYLITGGLVCERYGLPDKVVHQTCEESVFAVLRRLEPTGSAPVDPRKRATYREYGWVPTGQAGSWRAADGGLLAGEERLPTFPMTYVDGHRRRVLAAMVPVAARERYEAALPPATIDSNDPSAVLALPGRARLENVVLGLEGILTLAESSVMTSGIGSHDRLRESMFFAMVDLAAFLSDELPAVWNNPVPASTGTPLSLPAVLAQPAFGTTWLGALHQAHANRNLVLAELAQPPAPVTSATSAQMTTAVTALGVDAALTTVEDPFFVKVSTALEAVAKAATVPPAGKPVGKPEPFPPPSRTAGAVYVARLMYERPRCPQPQRLTVSEPTRTFRLAHLHDPDAPFRDNRIVLPIDTSLEGLRKFPKAVRMEISAQLRTQMERIQAIKLTDLEDGNIPDEKPLDLGMVCSLSIPIITICALVLLMIMVSLLNVVFFWVPLFKICLPKGP